MKTVRGTWGVRFLIHSLTVALGVLVFWLLGFFMKDVETISGPEWTEIERGYVDAKLYERQEELNQKFADLERKLSNLREQQQLVGSSSDNLQSTINQLLELQRLSIEKDVSQSASDKSTIATSLSGFLENQKRFQELNQQIAELAMEKANLEDEQVVIEKMIGEARIPAQEEFNRLTQAHRIRLAAYQLSILIPILFGAGFFLVKRRGSNYFPLFLAFGGATLVRTVLVIHEYFPARYFKYIVTIAMLIVVVRLLVYAIRLITNPKPESLMRQYREAYERFLCPVCDYPIRTGPRKWLYWTRRTVHKVLPQYAQTPEEASYTCPSCGTGLFETCGSCQKVRHSLLVHCEHCAAKKDVTSVSS